jgi:UPF0755 protein
MRVSRAKVLGLVSILLALAIFGGIHLLRSGVTSAPNFPCIKSSGGTVTIDVRSGESGSEIAKDLFDQGVIASSQSFFRLAVSDARSGRIAPGLHKIDLKICAKQALDQLLDSRRIGNLLSINEGAWNSEIKKSLAAIGYSTSEIASAFSQILVPHPYTTLEGLLFPAQYSFDTSISVNEILNSMIARGGSELIKSGIAQGEAKFTPSQLLTIASLVQAEGDTKDFAKISQVVRNRLAKGMPLQFDSTVHYVKQSRGSVFLSTQSTFINSPYNTYRRYGLPPGPINNPGFDAMYAATHPEPGVWLFFITVAPGDTRFTDSIDEFNSWKVLYKKNLNAGKFRSK